MSISITIALFSRFDLFYFTFTYFYLDSFASTLHDVKVLLRDRFPNLRTDILLNHFKSVLGECHQTTLTS